MKRIVTAMLTTITVLVLLFGYHTSTAGSLATTSETSVISGTQSGTTGTSGASSGSSASDGASTGSSSSDATTFSGTTADTRWGPVQVAITVAGGKVTDVSVVQYPNGNGKDQEINSYALPILIDETKQAQSAEIDMVSGATVTSDGYLQSLQSALDQAQL